MIQWIRDTEMTMFVIAAFTLGLAPFIPVPHIIEKLGMLFSGTLKKPIDWFDLVMHGTPWVLLFIKITVTILDKGRSS